ncbi:MAG: TIGR03619 family F420-dependent LLM class oxidoreductase [Myxococcota bacterium]
MTAPELKVRIGLGTATFPFSSARAYWRWIDLLESSGVDSLWQTDRLAGRQPFLETMSAMAAVAGATDRLKFGMNAVVVSLRDPLVLAKQCATIDYLSDGRLLPVFGVGGDNAPEWKATGRSPRRRGRRADEALEIIRRLWSEESVSFEGEHFRYDQASIAPRPVQQPLPLWIGGSSPAAIRRTARLGTGWLAGIQSPAQVKPVVAAIKEAAAEAGREIDEDHYGAGVPFFFGSWEEPEVQQIARARGRLPGAPDPLAYFAVGDAPAILKRLEEYRQAGCFKFVLIPLGRGDRAIEEQTRRLAAEVLPVAQAWRS